MNLQDYIDLVNNCPMSAFAQQVRNHAVGYADVAALLKFHGGELLAVRGPCEFWRVKFGEDGEVLVGWGQYGNGRWSQQISRNLLFSA